MFKPIWLKMACPYFGGEGECCISPHPLSLFSYLCTVQKTYGRIFVKNTGPPYLTREQSIYRGAPSRMVGVAKMEFVPLPPPWSNGCVWGGGEGAAGITAIHTGCRRFKRNVAYLHSQLSSVIKCQTMYIQLSKLLFYCTASRSPSEYHNINGLCMLKQHQYQLRHAVQPPLTCVFIYAQIDFPC